jgi:hypothetical protein
MLLEELGKAEYHHLNLSDKVQLMYLSSSFMVNESVLEEIINTLVEFKEFDEELWRDHRILYNQKFVDNVSDAYKKRNNQCVNRESLLQLIGIKSTRNNPKGKSKGDDKPQSKGKESKKEDTKLVVWLKANCPRVCAMANPITNEEAIKIVSAFPQSSDVADLFMSMENNKELHKKYTSAYLTFLSWSKRRIEANSNWGQQTKQTVGYP